MAGQRVANAEPDAGAVIPGSSGIYLTANQRRSNVATVRLDGTTPVGDADTRPPAGAGTQTKHLVAVAHHLATLSARLRASRRPGQLSDRVASANRPDTARQDSGEERCTSTQSCRLAPPE